MLMYMASLIKLKDDIENKIKNLDIPNSVNRHHLEQAGNHLLLFQTDINTTCENDPECTSLYLQQINDGINLINSRIHYLNEYFIHFKEQVATETNVTFLKNLKKYLGREKQILYYRNSKNTTSVKYAEIETYINLIDARINRLNASGLASGVKKRKIIRKTVKKNSKKRKTFKKK